MRPRVRYIVGLRGGSYVHKFTRNRGDIPSQYTCTAYTDQRDEAARMSYNVAQAVARKNNGAVEFE